MGEDFEFKPLTEGLGFHKKVIDLGDDSGMPDNESVRVVEPPPRRSPSEMPNTQYVDKALPQSAPQAARGGFFSSSKPAAATSPAMNNPNVSAAIARAAASSSTMNDGTTPSRAGADQFRTDAAASSRAASNAANPFHPQTRSASQVTAQAASSQMAASQAASANSGMMDTTTWKPVAEPSLGFQDSVAASSASVDRPVPYSWLAASFDTLVVFGLSLIFAALVFTITGVPYGNVLTLLEFEGPAQIATVALIVLVYELYVIISRVFFGRTLGEYAMGIRVGTRAQQDQWWYPLAVAWRGLVIAMTGFILLPLVSTLAKSDIAGLLSGVSLRSDNR